MKLKDYKLCKECGQPMLKKGQKRKNPEDYRHASGCPEETREWLLEAVEAFEAGKPIDNFRTTDYIP